MKHPLICLAILTLSAPLANAGERKPACETPQDPAITSLVRLAEQSQQAGTLALVERESEDCVLHPKDPFDPGAKMKHGKYQGECMDTSRKRAAVILKEDENEIVVANFFHQGRYWTAKVPKKGVESVVFQLAQFESPLPLGRIDHSQLRFMMKPDSPILLHSQELGTNETTIQGDFIISTQFTAPKGVEYSALEGRSPNYGLVTRLISTPDRAHEEIEVDGSPVTELTLHLKDSEKSGVLTEMIRMSSNNGLNKDYNLQNTNCTSVIFEILDKVAKYPPGTKTDPVTMAITDIFDPVRGPSLKALKTRGLLDGESWKPAMNWEYPQWKTNSF